MKDDFGYFGSGLGGYVQYNEAFKQNFDNASVPDNIPLTDKLVDNDPVENKDESDNEDCEI